MPYQINGYNVENYMRETTINDGKGIRTYYPTFPYSNATSTAAERMLNTGYRYGPTNLDLSTLGLAADSDTGAINKTIPAWCNRVCVIAVGGGGGGGGGGNKSGGANGGNGGPGGYGAVSYTPTSGNTVTPGVPIVIVVGGGGGGGDGASGPGGGGGNGGASNVVINGTNVLSAAGGNGGNGGAQAPDGYTDGGPGSRGTPTSQGALPSSYPSLLSSYGLPGGGGNGDGGWGNSGGNGQVYIWYKYAI
jgi:hypothetical protein